MQEISLNPQKLAGQCSKLKCCLVYEYDSYSDARREFPRVKEPLQAMDGEYFLVKSDILARTMSFSSAPNSLTNLITLPIERVREIIALNRRGVKVDTLLSEELSTIEYEPDYVNVIGEDSITRFDKSKKRRGGRNRNRNDRDKAHKQTVEQSQEQPSEQPQEERRANREPRREGGREGRNNRQRDRRQPREKQAVEQTQNADNQEQPERTENNNERQNNGERNSNGERRNHRGGRNHRNNHRPRREGGERNGEHNSNHSERRAEGAAPKQE